MTANVRLSVRQEAAIEARLSGASWREVARAVATTERTIRRWRTTPAFAGALRTAQAEAFADGLDVLKSNVRRAAETLAALLGDDEAGIRLRSATAIIEAGIKATETLDMLARLEALETAVGRRPGRAA